ncbi:hypothetical protein HMPREF3198_01202 [Winkia neuii]|nr:hypothetical protein HMPREF3198_01202 [Winkia neuii]
MIHTYCLRKDITFQGKSPATDGFRYYSADSGGEVSGGATPVRQCGFTDFAEGEGGLERGRAR